MPGYELQKARRILEKEVTTMRHTSKGVIVFTKNLASLSPLTRKYITGITRSEKDPDILIVFFNPPKEERFGKKIL